MSILDELLHPVSIGDFRASHFQQAPFALPGNARRFAGMVDANWMTKVLQFDHSDCWLPKEGIIPTQSPGGDGRLTPEQAHQGFAQGRTILIRHAEKLDPQLARIADDFAATFQSVADVQVYDTPAEQEGLSWHYDFEDVFVLQSEGRKEFRLRRNRRATVPRPLGSKVRLEEETVGPELLCLLHAGDWLYIPAGYWHKARAVTTSFHFSIGVASATPH